MAVCVPIARCFGIAARTSSPDLGSSANPFPARFLSPLARDLVMISTENAPGDFRNVRRGPRHSTMEKGWIHVPEAQKSPGDLTARLYRVPAFDHARVLPS